MLYVNMNTLYVNIMILHVDIMILHVDMIYLACKGKMCNHTIIEFYTAAVAQLARAFAPRAEGWVSESQPRNT